MATASDHLAFLLDVLASRANEGGKPDLSSAVDVVGDLIRLSAGGTEAQLRTAQDSVATLRERLERASDGIANRPAEVLRSQDAQIFLSGAMWAMSEVLGNEIRALMSSQQERRVRVTRKSTIANAVLRALKAGPATPTELRTSPMLNELEARRDEVSRALGELLAARKVEEVAASDGADRRTKVFRVTHGETVSANAG